MLEQKEHSNFKIKYDGQLHQVDANTLINSLLHITAIMQEINDELNRELGIDKKLEIKINAFSDGSFLVDLQLVSGLLKGMGKLLSGGVDSCKTILDILIALFTLKKFLKGKKPDRVEEKGNDVKIYIDNRTIVVNKRVNKLYGNNNTINEATTKNFETLDNDPCIEGLEILDENEKELL
jgi:hypothetical protein